MKYTHNPGKRCQFFKHLRLGKISEQIILHCSDSLWGSAAEIRKWHLSNGWKDMGYDLVKVNDITINTTAPSYVVFSPQNIILDKGESIGADISPYTNKPLTHEELETARRVIENKLSAIPKGLYEITTQRGMYKNYDTNEVDVEPSFHVTLNTTDPKYTNAFVMALNEFAQEHGQQSFQAFPQKIGCG